MLKTLLIITSISNTCPELNVNCALTLIAVFTHTNAAFTSQHSLKGFGIKNSYKLISKHRCVSEPL